jgi:hypothetical protein
MNSNQTESGYVLIAKTCGGGLDPLYVYKALSLLLVVLFVTSPYLFLKENIAYSILNSTQPLQDSITISNSSDSFQNASKYELVKTWDSRGTGNGQFCHMEHLAIDKFDNVYVDDPQSDPGCSLQPCDHSAYLVLQF